MKTVLAALNAHYMHTNLAVRQLQGALKRDHVTATVFESHINIPYRKLLEQLAGTAPDILAFSCYIWNIELIHKLCRAIKKAIPSVMIVLGGPEVSYSAADVLSENRAVDYVLSGEGEQTLPALIRTVECGGNLDLVDGLTFRRGSEIHRTRDVAPLLPELWVDAYSDGIAGLEKRILYIETSRGCPYHCRYCLSSEHSGGVRGLSVDISVERLTRLAEQGASLIKLVDRTFNYDKKRANEIWAGLIEHSLRTGVHPVYHFEIGAHLIDEAAVEVLRRAPKGLFQFEIGIQSSDDDVLRQIERTARFEDIKNAVHRLKALNTIHLHVDLIAGLPGEDMRTFARSFDDAYRIGAEMMQLGFLKLLKGSGLRRDADVMGIVYEDNAPYEVISTKSLTFSELCLLKDIEVLLDWYGNSGRYMRGLHFLIGEGSPFELFSLMVKRFRDEGVFDMERGEKARAEAFYRFGVQYAQPQVFAALLRHDLLLAGRRKELPDELAFTETNEQRALLRARFHPVRGQSAFEYSVDVESYMERLCIVERKTLIIYDPPQAIVIA